MHGSAVCNDNGDQARNIRTIHYTYLKKVLRFPWRLLCKVLRSAMSDDS
jgi:hypothetical protein